VRRGKANEKSIVFRPEGAQPYDDRMLSWQMAERRISIWTVAGRIKDVAFTAAPEQLATVELNRKGESDLVCREGMWFLLATPADGRLHRDVQDHQPVVGRLPGGRGAHQHGYRRLERLVSRLVLRGRTELTQAWNADVTKSGMAVTAKNLTWNANVTAGSSVSFGFTGSWTGANTKPTSFKLGDQTCAVS
jgi:hypothetical protein